VACVDRAVEIDPASGLMQFHRGTVLLAAKKLADAIAALRCAIERLPHLAEAHYNLANALRADGQWAASIDSYRAALRLNPDHLSAGNNLALSLVHEKQYEEARTLAAQLVLKDGAYGDGWLTLCNVAEKLNDYQTALVAGQRAVDLMPNSHFSWFGYAVALNRLDRHEEAIDAYRKALTLGPDHVVDVLDNLAQSYQALNRLEEAEKTFRCAVDVAGQTIADEDARDVTEEEYGNRHWHLALIELLQGKYRQGFARYRSRFAEIDELNRLSFPWPLWKGEDLRDKTLLVCDEQGYGDTLMLARFLPEIRARGARVVFLLHKVLAPLFRGWDGADMIVTHGGKLPLCDYHCATFDLPYRLGVTLDSLPARVPYLPMPQPTEATRLPPCTARRIGIVWGGSPLHKNDRTRSVPLSLISGLFSTPGCQFYSFNRDLKEGDADILNGLPIENLAPRLTDFAQAARFAAQMDLIITCDTATAHLAGGLGLPVWVMLPYSPDWRWLTGRDDSPWYPNARLFRQPRPGDWQGVVAALAAALAKL
jgi:tetratricopeptide (TPR) repeat protein